MVTEKTKIIAEVSSNHGGDLKIAKEFIRVAANIGIDYIKFQSWQAKKMKEDDHQYEWFLKSELKDEMHYELINECKKYNINFLTTCFDIERIEFLSSLGLDEIKVGSADTASYKMLSLLKKRFKHLIVSTGMATDEEIIKAAEVLNGVKFTFLHCVSIYPTPPEKVNLKRMDWLKQFTESVGYSDHTIGIEAVKLAIARGANYVEKHFTLGEDKCPRTMPWDANPKDFEEIVKYRDICSKFLGDGKLIIDKDFFQVREKSIGRFGSNK